MVICSVPYKGGTGSVTCRILGSGEVPTSERHFADLFFVKK
jgi:hypothetical protein